MLATAGVESEAELGFAGLHQLLFPIFRGIDLLPDINAWRSRRRSARAERRARSLPCRDGRIPAHQRCWRTLTVGPARRRCAVARPAEPRGPVTFIARRLERSRCAGRDRANRIHLAVHGRSFADRRAPASQRRRGRVAARPQRTWTASGIPRPASCRSRRRPACPGRTAAHRSFLDGLTGSPSPGPPTLNAQLVQAFAASLRGLTVECRLALLAAALDSRVPLDEIDAFGDAPARLSGVAGSRARRRRRVDRRARPSGAVSAPVDPFGGASGGAGAPGAR